MATPATPSGPFTIRQRGKVVAQAPTLEEALAWLLANQPDSSRQACSAGGYDVRDPAGRRYFQPPRRF